MFPVTCSAARWPAPHRSASGRRAAEAGSRTSCSLGGHGDRRWCSIGLSPARRRTQGTERHVRSGEPRDRRSCSIGPSPAQWHCRGGTAPPRRPSRGAVRARNVNAGEGAGPAAGEAAGDRRSCAIALRQQGAEHLVGPRPRGQATGTGHGDRRSCSIGLSPALRRCRGGTAPPRRPSRGAVRAWDVNTGKMFGRRGVTSASEARARMARRPRAEHQRTATAERYPLGTRRRPHAGAGA